MKNKITRPINDSVKFQPKPETLPPLSELIKQSTITITDVTNANEAWKDFAPNEYRNLMEAD